MEKIQYSSPQENIEKDKFSGHSFDLFIDGVKIGYANVKYLSKPLPYYLLSYIDIDPAFRNKKYASKILDQTEAWIKERGKPGVLLDAIFDDEPAVNMYARRGWQEVPGSYRLYTYNWPKDVDPTILKTAAVRYKYDHLSM